MAEPRDDRGPELPDNPPAFPVDTQDGAKGHQSGAHTWQFPGMTLRDYFAAKAMVGMVSDIWPDTNDRREIAARAYSMADEMLKARAK